MIVREHIVSHDPYHPPKPDDIGARLGYANWSHFGQVQGIPDIGLGHCSCNATVAIEVHPNYSKELYGNFSVIHGNSQIYRGLDPDNPGPNKPKQMFASSKQGQHAEQIAVQVAINQPVDLWMNTGSYHLYIDLGPCPKCKKWLTARPEPFTLYYTVDYTKAKAGHLERMHKMNKKHFNRELSPTRKTQ